MKRTIRDIRNLRRMDLLGRDFQPDQAQKMCWDKHKFPTKNEARDFASRGERLNNFGRQESYKCKLCGNFHLTTITSAVWKTMTKPKNAG